MTGTDMLTQLGLRMEDVKTTTDGYEYTIAIKLEAINNAMLKVCMLLDRKQLRPLSVSQTAISATSGALNLGDLTATPLLKEGDDIHSGIYSLSFATGIFCHFLSPLEVAGSNQNAFKAASARNPRWYIKGIDSDLPVAQILPATTVSVDVMHLKRPTDMAANATECLLDEDQHEIILDFAESALWLTANRLERSNAAYERAAQSIGVLNGIPEPVRE